MQAVRLEITFRKDNGAPEGKAVWIPDRWNGEKTLPGKWIYTKHGSKRPTPMAGLPSRIKKQLRGYA